MNNDRGILQRKCFASCIVIEITDAKLIDAMCFKRLIPNTERQMPFTYTICSMQHAQLFALEPFQDALAETFGFEVFVFPLPAVNRRARTEDWRESSHNDRTGSAIAPWIIDQVFDASDRVEADRL